MSGAITSSVEAAAGADGGDETRRDRPGRAGCRRAGRRLRARWQRCVGRFDAREYADYRALKWSKALLNMLGNATAAILDMTVEQVYADPRLVTSSGAVFWRRWR